MWEKAENRKNAGGRITMYRRGKLRSPEDFFVEKRGRNEVYFCRINGYSSGIHDFIKKYYTAAKEDGAVIEGGIRNPDENMLAYYSDTMGSDFRADLGFIEESLKKWMPEIPADRRKEISDSIYHVLTGMKKAGKPEGVLKNVYIKFLCWLYYSFGRIVPSLEKGNIPKILYEGKASAHEFLFMNVLADAGCDIVMLQYNGDMKYIKADTESRMSQVLSVGDMRPFPDNFSLKDIKEETKKKKEITAVFPVNEKEKNKPARQYQSRQAPMGGQSRLRSDSAQRRVTERRDKIKKNCTNAWITGEIFKDIRTQAGERGKDGGYFYNCFFRIRGTDDRISYPEKLYRLRRDLLDEGRPVVVINGRIPPPSTDEAGKIRRAECSGAGRMISMLEVQIVIPDNAAQEAAVRAFRSVIEAESTKPDMNLNRLTSSAIYAVCWLKQYGKLMFNGKNVQAMPCFFCMGGRRAPHETVFLKILARMPVDVVIFCPDSSEACDMDDTLLFERNGAESMQMDRYPESASDMEACTAAYHAERDLDTILYSGTGLYRNRQFKEAGIVSLKTMYEEIPMLWKEELRYRPGFSESEGAVNIPVIYSKICGVKDSDTRGYWNGIRDLMDENTVLITDFPHITEKTENPVKQYATEFLKNGKLRKEYIKKHKAYEYGFLEMQVQDRILDTIDRMIRERRIAGTFENGTEYTIAASLLDLDKDTLRKIQAFDLTKINPKLICISTGESRPSVEDAVRIEFLHMLGFDVLIFTPTGYRFIEDMVNGFSAEEHKTGAYMYDLEIPDLRAPAETVNERISWWNSLFGRSL